MTGTLPGKEAAGTTTPEPRPMVLVVDDDIDFCSSLADILNSKGFRAIPAGTCEEACFLLGELQPEVALVDMRLPDSSGLEVLAYAQQRSPHTGVVILTGHASLDSAIRALNMGAVSYLIKPCKMDRVLLAVERALARTGSQPDSEEKTKPDSLISVLPNPAIMFDLETGHVLYLNQAAERLFGIQDSCFQCSLSSLFGSSTTKVIDQHIVDIRTNGQGRADVQLESSELGSRWYQLLSVRHPRSRRTGFSVLTDVTEQRERQVQQHREHQYLEAIIDNIPIPLAIISGDYQLQRVSPAFARLYGVSTRELAGRPCHSVVHQRATPCRFHGESCPISVCIATGTTARASHQHRDTDGNIRFVETTVAPLRDESDTIVAFIAMMVDYTEIRRAQEESEAKSVELTRLNRELIEQQRLLEQQAGELSAANMELIRLSAAKDDFIATVSHELRTPLTAISESISLLSDSSLQASDETGRKLLDVAVRNCSRLTELIDDLLDLAKLESNRVTTQPVVLDINHVLSETVGSFAVLARDRDVQLVIRHPDVPVRAWADERHVRRILANLVSNAIKFTRHGTVTLDAARAGADIVISVTDTGCGIPATEVDRVFEKFHQASTPYGERPRGTGLGLAITKRLVEMNGGRIWFETQEDVGTSFHFTLPMQQVIPAV
ncbi:MAG: ATP-binding protein [candidate division WOR-3 bacterium]